MFEFIKKIFGKPELKKSDSGYIEVYSKEFFDKYTENALELYAVRLAAEYISKSISACEFRIFENNRENTGDDFYSFNISPNIYQTAAEFKREMAYTLLLDSEVLVIAYTGQYVIADSFNLDSTNPAKPVFKDIVIFGGMELNKPYGINEVIYIKYKDGQIRHLLSSVLSGYSDLMKSAAETYKTTGGQKGILKVESVPEADTAIGEAYKDLMNTRFSTFFKSKNAVLPLFEGFSYVPQTQDKTSGNDISNYNSLKDNALALAAGAFKIPVGLLRGDVVNVDEITKTYITFCINPFAELIGQGFCRALISPQNYKKGFYMYLDTARVQLTNIFEMAEKVDKIFGDGIFCIDEVRRKFREPELKTKMSTKRYVTKNYSDVNEHIKEEN